MSDIFAEYKKEIFMNFSNCSFFELFLFPWISKETIERVNEKILDNVIMFLNECCIIVKNYILETSNLNIFRDMENVWYLNSEIMHGDRIPGLESVIVDDKDLLSYMQNSLNEGMSIVRIKRGDNKNNILLSEPPSDGFSYKDRLLLAYKDKENESNFISFFKNAEGSSLFNYSIGHKLISNPMFYPIGEDLDLKSLYLKAVFSIVMGVSKDDDLKLLKEDVKFMETLSELKERFNEGYELLAK